VSVREILNRRAGPWTSALRRRRELVCDAVSLQQDVDCRNIWRVQRLLQPVVRPRLALAPTNFGFRISFRIDRSNGAFSDDILDHLFESIGVRTAERGRIGHRTLIKLLK
jgi:hypothetical protein